jgi:hypothetical protein
MGALIREHEKDLGDFMSQDPRGRKLPVYIAQLAEHLTNEQTTLATELELIKKNIEEIKEIVAMQQNHARLAGAVDTSKVTASVEAAIRKSTGLQEQRDVKNSGRPEPHVSEATVKAHKLWSPKR